MKTRLERRYRFSASHLYRRPEWSEQENRSRFGKCANQPGHGHNYRLWVAIEGEPEAGTGFVMDLGGLDQLVQSAVIDRLDHQHLNSAIAAFGDGGKIPSSENVLEWIHGQLAGRLPGLVRLRLAEDEDLVAEWVKG